MCVCAVARAVIERSPSSSSSSSVLANERREEGASAGSIESGCPNNFLIASTRMKAMVVSPVSGRVPPNHRGGLHNGLGIGGTRRDLEAEEVAAYLTKLRSLVPDMPRKRKLSKLEVIQRVIEYICDLQTTLEETNAGHQDAKTTMTTTTTAAATAAAAAEATVTMTTQSSRQPLLNAATSTATTPTTTSVVTATVADR